MSTVQILRAPAWPLFHFSVVRLITKYIYISVVLGYINLDQHTMKSDMNDMNEASGHITFKTHYFHFI